MVFWEGLKMTNIPSKCLPRHAIPLKCCYFPNTEQLAGLLILSESSTEPDLEKGDYSNHEISPLYDAESKQIEIRLALAQSTSSPDHYPLAKKVRLFCKKYFNELLTK